MIISPRRTFNGNDQNHSLIARGCSALLDASWKSGATTSLLAVSAAEAVLFDKLDTTKMHGLDTFDVSRHDVTSKVEFGLKLDLHSSM